MRLQLNLNKYYEGLEDYQVATLFGLFVNTKPNIKDMKLLLEANGTKDTIEYMVSRAHAISSFLSIDEFMKSLGKSPIFEIEKLREKTGGNLKDIDEDPLIAKYNYLMSEPEKDKEVEFDD